MTDVDVGRSVIGYGSLLHPDEIAKIFDNSLSRVVPVKVDGFRRIFNNEATWREMEGNERAVLNVVPDSERWFNGLLIPFADETEAQEYREREEGYDFQLLEPEQVTPYRQSDSAMIEDVSRIQIPVGHRTSTAIKPIPSYVRICLKGAKYWDSKLDQDFLDDFKRTTEIADGTSLPDYLSSQPIKVDKN